MNTVAWSPDMRLGLPRIDAAHESFLRELVEMEDVEDGRFCNAFLNLVARIENDFHEEELQMEEIDYAGLACHREQHARVLGALHHVAARVMAGETAVGREAIDLLPQWFVLHLSTMDTALALALELASGTTDPDSALNAQPTS